MRLTAGHSGRVLILYDSEWGFVCGDDEWDLDDARVVCRQLGYERAIYASIISSKQGPQLAWMSSVQCQGNETSLSSCRHERFMRDNCSIGKYAGVTCGEHSGYGLQGVRLTGGRDNLSGRVLILYDSQWGSVCGDNEWDFDDAKVVCRQLGYEKAIYATILSSKQGPQLAWMSSVQCQGKETSLSSCRHEIFMRDYCNYGMYAGVICEGKSEDEAQWIRLVDGFSNASGRVEVFINGEWGTVCGYNWDMKDAMVVCRQLGYQTARAVRRGFFGEGYRFFWISDVECTGDELSLAECIHTPLSEYNYCFYGQDAGVICQGKTNHYKFVLFKEVI
ncbi:hypothetical protein HOLleu_35678 [Holothuria leucospilota]|uniref:SRCR domain-containing protein n=1 Tax=Holothuria leucospilota TaxID=206669 RepID=A0A9Q1BE57_HOLLE|nr:hypothetical protein HOLleu_35678 [Holothuria leucospilota]